MTHPILEAERLTEDTLELLREHHNALLAGLSFGGWPMEHVPGARLLRAATGLTDQLRSSDGRPAARAILKMAARVGGLPFYASNLGRAVAWWIGVPAPGGTPPAALVANALGVSRQRVQELQRAGRLTTPEAVAEEMQRRWP